MKTSSLILILCLVAVPYGTAAASDTPLARCVEALERSNAGASSLEESFRECEASHELTVEKLERLEGKYLESVRTSQSLEASLEHCANVGKSDALLAADLLAAEHKLRLDAEGYAMEAAKRAGGKLGLIDVLTAAGFFVLAAAATIPCVKSGGEQGGYCFVAGAGLGAGVAIVAF